MFAATASMALRRCLLRRITPGPGVPVPRTTVQAAPAPSISRRFMGTASLQGEPRTTVVLHEDVVGVESAKFRRSIEEFDRLNEELTESNKAVWIKMDEKKKIAAEKLNKINNVGLVVVAAVPVLVVIAKNYLAYL